MLGITKKKIRTMKRSKRDEADVIECSDDMTCGCAYECMFGSFSLLHIHDRDNLGIEKFFSESRVTRELRGIIMMSAAFLFVFVVRSQHM